MNLTTVRSQRRQILAITALLAAVFLPAPAQDSPDDHPGTLRGTVLNSVTREPIPRALVFSPDNRFAALTDSEGHFEFSIPKLEPAAEPAPGPAPQGANAPEVSAPPPASTNVFLPVDPAQLSARKPGFLPDPNGFPTLEPSTHDLVLTLMPEALIIGHVALPSADAAESIQVEIYRRQVQEGRPHWLPAGTVTTRSTGEFRFAELAPGTYKLLTHELLDRDPETFNPRGQLYGYPPAYFSGAPDFSSATTIELSPGKIAQAELSLVKQPYYSIKVPVANLDPGSFVQVAVLSQGHAGPGFSLGYNQRTRSIEGLLPPGNYTLEASSTPNSFASGVTNISVKAGPVEGPRLTVVSDRAIRLNVKEDFTLTENAAEPDAGFRPGVAQDSNATQTVRTPGPRDYLNVQLRPVDDFVQDRGTSLRPPAGPDDTSLWLNNVLPGRYWVEIHSSRGFVASVTSGDVDLLRNPLVVPQGGSVSPIEITLRDDGAHVEVTIEGVTTPAADTDQSASSLSSAFPTGITSTLAWIYFVPTSNSTGQFAEAQAFGGGHFTSPLLVPGAYRILAFKRPQPELEYRDLEAMRPYESQGQVITLEPGQKQSVTLHLVSRSD